jgi:hypothetical protein
LLCVELSKNGPSAIECRALISEWNFSSRERESRSLFRIPTVCVCVCVFCVFSVCTQISRTFSFGFVLKNCWVQEPFLLGCCCCNLENILCCLFRRRPVNVSSPPTVTAPSQSGTTGIISRVPLKRTNWNLGLNSSLLVDGESRGSFHRHCACDVLLFLAWRFKSRCQWDQLGRSRWELNETVFVAISLDPVGRRL